MERIMIWHSFGVTNKIRFFHTLLITTDHTITKTYTILTTKFWSWMMDVRVSRNVQLLKTGRFFNSYSSKGKTRNQMKKIVVMKNNWQTNKMEKRKALKKRTIKKGIPKSMQRRLQLHWLKNKWWKKPKPNSLIFKTRMAKSYTKE